MVSREEGVRRYQRLDRSNCLSTVVYKRDLAGYRHGLEGEIQCAI